MRPTDTFSSEINQLTISLGIIIFEVKTFLGAPHTLFLRGSELVFDRHASRCHVTRPEVKGSFE
jgi:hypothetical protein